MTIIVEDGTLVPNANSYISAVEADAILADFGFPALPVLTAESLILSACQYVESFRERFRGMKLTADQALVFPRAGLMIDCWNFPSDEIPKELKKAQALAAHNQATGSALYSNSTGQEVASKSVDVISISYFQSGAASAQPSFGMINSQLGVLLKSSVNVGMRRV